MLHYLDDLDSKMESMRAHLEREEHNGSDWAGWNSSLERPLLNSRKFLEPKAEEPRAEEPATAAAAAGDSESK